MAIKWEERPSGTKAGEMPGTGVAAGSARTRG